MVLKYSGAAFSAAPEVFPSLQRSNTMKRIEITGDVLAPSDVEGEMKTLFTGSVVDVDDNTAGLICAAGRGKFVARDKDGKFEKAPVDTTPVDPKPAEKPAK
jgi:hypothetical protein